MIYFQKITKKKFIEDMLSSSVILIKGGYSKRTLEDFEFEKYLIDVCEHVDIDNEEQCICTTQSNALIRQYPNGEKSTLYFDTEGVKSFYEYQNIRVVETFYKGYNKRNYVVYLCV